MAEACPNDDNSFHCSVCLDPLRDPVTLSCGHSYCMSCISDCWDQEEQKGKYSCPQCRETFTPRPVLKKNTILAELVEKMKTGGIQTAPPGPCYARPGDVECDFCCEIKLKAVKSCLVCQVSLCETHIQPHNDIPALKKHKLVKAIQLQDMICSQHGNPLQVFCRTDQKCICMLCTMDEHKGHDTVSAAAGRKEKEGQLGKTKKKYQQRIQKREKELQKLKDAVKSHNDSAQEAEEHSERIFTELLQSIEKRRSEVKELIRAQQKAAVSRAEGILERLEQEIAELRRGDAEMEQLSHEEDHVHFLQTFQALLASPVSNMSPSVILSSCMSFKDLVKSLTDLQNRVKEIITEDIEDISEEAKKIKIVLPMEPKTREEFLEHSDGLTLDLYQKDELLSVSMSGHEVTFDQDSDMSSFRMADDFATVLCEPLSECCYWEAEWSSEENNRTAILLRWKKRRSDDDDDDGEWEDEDDGNEDEEEDDDDDDDDDEDDKTIQMYHLSWDVDDFSFFNSQTDEETQIPITPASRIGVYLDPRAGTLSFYNVCDDTMTLLHRVQTTFTKPPRFGFGLQPNTSVKICSDAESGS